MSDLAAWARTIGQTIRRLRLSQGLTQQDLAGDAFSKSYISQLERGSVIPSLRALDILAERLGVPTTFFIEGTGKGAGFLLKIATISYFIGDVEQAAFYAHQLESEHEHFRHTEKIEYQLLLVRLAGRQEDWEEVHAGCQRLESLLAPQPYKSPDVIVPQSYWWGKAWLVEGNQRQAARRWEYGLKHLGAQPGPPSEEGLRLMLELADLYRRLGDQKESERITQQIQAILEQLTSLQSLVRWFLARYHERAERPAGSVDGDLFGEITAASDAEAWAKADALLRSAAEIRRHLGAPSPPPTS